MQLTHVIMIGAQCITEQGTGSDKGMQLTQLIMIGAQCITEQGTGSDKGKPSIMAWELVNINHVNSTEMIGIWFFLLTWMTAD